MTDVELDKRVTALEENGCGGHSLNGNFRSNLTEPNNELAVRVHIYQYPCLNTKF